MYNTGQTLNESKDPPHEPSHRVDKLKMEAHMLPEIEAAGAADMTNTCCIEFQQIHHMLQL